MTSYDNWSRESLIAKVLELEKPKKPSNPPSTSTPHSQRVKKQFTVTSYPRRKIALKFCYAGWDYNGLAYQSYPTPLPTVEGVLFDALAHLKLIDPEKGFEGCGWEKCGRTDRGVSAAGQVISLWVRSTLKEFEHGMGGESSATTETDIADSEKQLEDPILDDPSSVSLNGDDNFSFSNLDLSDISPPSSPKQSRPPPPPKPELRYIQIINSVLPPTIRIIAWSPVATDFSARYGCQYRHYKYFFNPAGLNISAMRDAASRLVGEHDFRNLCKLDASKQITMFRRVVKRVDIVPVEPDECGAGADVPPGSGYHNMHVLNLVGSAFLYHQVRHIMGILYLVGSGLEHPSLVTSLLNVDAEAGEHPHEGEGAMEYVSCKPIYYMADALPLLLWDCGYKEDDVNWMTDDGQVEGATPNPNPNGMEEDGRGFEKTFNVYQELYFIRERSLLRATMDSHFLATAAKYHAAGTPLHPTPRVSSSSSNSNPSPSLATSGGSGGKMRIPLGGGTFTRTGQYTPVLQRKRLEDIMIVNKRWAEGKGGRREARKEEEKEVPDGGDE